MTEFLDQNVDVHSQTREAASPVAQPQESKLDQTIRQFEIEFGRMISPIERQMIQSWFTVDHYDAGVIQLALREAVLAQVYNFKYVDRILLNWQRMNLKTTLQVERYLQQ
ncbi:DnaD domain-containing protein [Amylolactobacillus amylophilus]|uniref:DnaD domain-containing protein n=1 Tax=Amylolactobacillus amylophilus TaxID=1603 RepID=UPI003F70381B